MYSCKIININSDRTFDVKAINYYNEFDIMILTFRFYEVTNHSQIEVGRIFDWDYNYEEVTIKDDPIFTDSDNKITQEYINSIFE
jgi:hypothetical protein